MKNILFLLIATTLFACTKIEQETEIIEHGKPDISSAVAVIHPKNDSDVTGVVSLTATENGIKIDADINGLTDNKHGFHIHQYGDCSAADGTSAGGHFNPDNNNHSGPTDEMRHMGDMGNLQGKGANSTSTLSYIDSTIKLNQVIGRAIIIHAGEDDLTSQPTGAAGARIGCGVIGIAK